jgi:hypothetical protein
MKYDNRFRWIKTQASFEQCNRRLALSSAAGISKPDNHGGDSSRFFLLRYQVYWKSIGLSRRKSAFSQSYPGERSSAAFLKYRMMLPNNRGFADGKTGSLQLISGKESGTSGSYKIEWPKFEITHLSPALTPRPLGDTSRSSKKTLGSFGKSLGRSGKSSGRPEKSLGRWEKSFGSFGKSLGRSEKSLGKQNNIIHGYWDTLPPGYKTINTTILKRRPSCLITIQELVIT